MPGLEDPAAWRESRGCHPVAQLIALSGPSWISVPLLRIDPPWGPLRKNPKFQALLAR